MRKTKIFENLFDEEDLLLFGNSFVSINIEDEKIKIKKLKAKDIFINIKENDTKK